jgi:hypothetical protein
MPGTTVRIREETRAALRELEDQTGEGPQALLARAVDQFRRSLILAETNVAYARLRQPHELGINYETALFEAELSEWETTVADGLEARARDDVTTR